MNKKFGTRIESVSAFIKCNLKTFFDLIMTSSQNVSNFLNFLNLEIKAYSLYGSRSS